VSIEIKNPLSVILREGFLVTLALSGERSSVLGFLISLSQLPSQCHLNGCVLWSPVKIINMIATPTEEMNPSDFPN